MATPNAPTNMSILTTKRRFFEASRTPQPATVSFAALFPGILIADNIAPPVPGGLTATAVSSSQINVSWNAVTDTGGSGLRGYRLYRNGGTTPINPVDSTATTFNDTGLSPGTFCSYRVSSYDAQGNESAQSSAATATTQSGAVSDITSYQLTSSVGGTSLPHTFAHAFKQGDIPSGSFITTDVGGQADVRNRWSDGSVKFAVITALKTLTANVAGTLTIQRTATSPSSLTVAEPTALFLGNNISVTITGTGAGTYTPSTARQNGITAWNRATARKVREILGPVMSEFHYYSPTADGHLTIWWYVRQYVSGQTEVETVIENGWLNVASPTSKSYSATIAIGGITIFGPSALTQLHHTRWSRIDWIGTNPAITPAHNTSYLRGTKLVPNYGYLTPTAAAFNGLASALNPTPFALGNWQTDMSATGEGWPQEGSIGVMTHWDALYCINADSRAYAAVISNTRGHGRWPAHFRDETTGRVPLHQTYPTMQIVTDGGGAVVQPPAPGGAQNGVGWEIPHHPSIGYMAYLIEGRWSQMETLQFSAMYSILDANPNSGHARNALGSGSGIIACDSPPMTTRGCAWAQRTVGQAACLSPETVNDAAPSAADLAVGTSFKTSLANTMTYLKGKFVDGSIGANAYKNTVGWLGHYDWHPDGLGTTYPAGQWWGVQFMVQFQIAALAHISDLGINGISQSNLTAVRDHAYDGVLRLIGTDATFNYRHAALYDLPYLSGQSSTGPPNDPPTFITTAQAYQQLKSFFGFAAATANAGDTLKDIQSDNSMTPGGSSNDKDGYWAKVIANLSTAVEHAKAGAAAAFTLVTASTSYNPVSHNINDAPRWGIRSRVTPSGSLPTWLQGKAIFEWSTLQSPSANAAMLPSPSPPPNTTPPGNVNQVSDAWCGAFLRTSGSYFGLNGGGHTDYGGNEIYAMQLNTDSPVWARIFGPTSNAQIVEDQFYYLDGKWCAQHTYYFLQFDNSGDRLLRLDKSAYGSHPGPSEGVDVWPWMAANILPSGTIPNQPRIGGSFFAGQGATIAPNGDVFEGNNGERYHYHKSSNSWTRWDGSIDFGNMGMCYDTARNVAWGIGGNNIPTGSVLRWNANSTESVLAVTGNAASQINGANTYAAAYDPVVDKIFFTRGTGVIYQFDPVTMTATTVATTGTPPNDISAGAGGKSSIWNRFQYVPELGGIVTLARWSDPVKFIRTNTGSAQPTTYNTAFPSTENPLSQGGIWTQGGDVGLLWQNMQCAGGAPGTGYGTGITSIGATDYNDNIAILKNRFSLTKHYAEVIVRKDAGYSPADSHEQEILLGFDITPNNARGYEMDFQFGGLDPVRWNGARGNFTGGIFTTLSGSSNVNPSDGQRVLIRFDVTSGTPTFTVFLGTGAIGSGMTGLSQVWQFADNTAQKLTAGGSPGIGAFYRPAISPANFQKHAIRGFGAGNW